MTAWVYIAECADGSYYTGSARGDSLEPRQEACPDPR